MLNHGPYCLELTEGLDTYCFRFYQDLEGAKKVARRWANLVWFKYNETHDSPPMGCKLLEARGYVVFPDGEADCQEWSLVARY